MFITLFSVVISHYSDSDKTVTNEHYVSRDEEQILRFVERKRKRLYEEYMKHNLPDMVFTYTITEQRSYDLSLL